jgi:hypothetical protein
MYFEPEMDAVGDIKITALSSYVKVRILALRMQILEGRNRSIHTQIGICQQHRNAS